MIRLDRPVVKVMAYKDICQHFAQPVEDFTIIVMPDNEARDKFYRYLVMHDPLYTNYLSITGFTATVTGYKDILRNNPHALDGATILWDDRAPVEVAG